MGAWADRSWFRWRRRRDRPRKHDRLTGLLIYRALSSWVKMEFPHATQRALQPFTMTSLPFFNPSGELIGVGNYVTSARAPDPT
jgi:hypothetical protein